MKTLFSVADAAAYLSQKADYPLSEDDVYDLAKQGKLDACFKFDGELFNVSIRNPDGTVEQIKRPCPFDGILMFSSPALPVTHVRVVRVDAQRFRHASAPTPPENQKERPVPVLVAGVKMPTIEDSGGMIKPGYRVAGWLDFEDVPVKDWLFHVDDLQSLRDGIKAPSQSSRAHVSGKLAFMNQAAEKFWANADRNDRGTHPSNAVVKEWLKKKGFSETLAGKAATIIRPDWAPTGRKPEE